MLVEQMTWEEYRAEVSRRIIILPVGSLEQQGPHLPLNVDVVIPTSLARMVSEELRHGVAADCIRVQVTGRRAVVSRYD